MKSSAQKNHLNQQKNFIELIRLFRQKRHQEIINHNGIGKVHKRQINKND